MYELASLYLVPSARGQCVLIKNPVPVFLRKRTPFFNWSDGNHVLAQRTRDAMSTATEPLSKSKLKRLKRKEKSQRIEATLLQEKTLRVSAENSVRHWKHKATL